MPRDRGTDGPEALPANLAVSRGTLDRLETYAALLRRWQRTHNLVAGNTLDALWRRHIADSLQLRRIAPAARRWLDLGSGGGLPGLPLAIALACDPESHVHLVESNAKKCAFLRAVIRETGAPATVHCVRIESALERWTEPVDTLSARALAPLERLLGWTAPLIARGTPAYFHKGRDCDREIAEASQNWTLDLVRHKSLAAPDSVVLEIRAAVRRGDR